jgi:hypothetical protein
VSRTSFDWMETPTAPRASGETKGMRDGELSRRAQLLANLGFSRADVEKRLKARLEWEHEGLGKAGATKRVSTIVSEVFAKTPPPPAPASSSSAKKKPKR